MLKVLLTVSCFVALTYVAFGAVIIEGCLYETEMWGSIDGTKFYICLPDTNTAIEQNCPTDTFFVSNATYSGCLPNDKMNPACVNLEPVGACTGNNLLQPQPSSDPTQFYICTSENSEPIILPCPSGKAFLKQDLYLGCFDWELWRDIRGCPA